MGATPAVSRSRVRLTRRCPLYLGRVLRLKAYAYHARFDRWFTFNYAWRSWLPANWYGVARCETGVNWEHSNGSFTSAFGISWREYDRDAAYMGAPAWRVRHTPRDQFRAALGHYARFGDGWSCPGP
jgi:hypothetical protein